MKSFETWTYEEVQDTFGIKRIFNSDILTSWLQAVCEIPDNKKYEIENLRKTLLLYIDSWNEDEIKFHFIGPFITQVNFLTDKYKSFTQRTLHLKTDKVETGGRIDMMVCTGIQKPKQPFFFFNEYKPSKRGTNDPLGQLLIEMITAQHINQNNFPIYGAYTEGRAWYFVVLDGKEYAVSNIYDACTDSIYQIYAILCKVKEYINDIIS